MQPNRNWRQWLWQTPRWLKLTLILALAAGLFFSARRHGPAPFATTFVARRGPLNISVLQGGSTEALESQDIKSEVRGYQGTKILKIVEEGYQVTEEDLKNGKVLVELDSSEIQKQITQQDIQFQSTVATLREAEQAYDIQLNQNLSDIKSAEQKAKFARMDFEKFMGDAATGEIIKELGLDESLDDPLETAALRSTELGNPVPGTAGPGLVPTTAGSGTAAINEANALKLAAGVVSPAGAAGSHALARASQSNAPAATLREVPKFVLRTPEPLKRVTIDFAKYARLELLGDGEAKQKIRKFDDDWQLAQKEMGQAKTKLEGTKRLFDKGFVTKTEYENDEIQHNNTQLKVQTAETARSLFLKYEFPKTAEEFMSKYAEAMRELGRTRKGAVSKLAQAEAKLKSAEGRYNLELRQRKDLNDQMDKCVIRAKKTGLVVYGGRNRYEYYPQEQIREGAMIREQQPIITIPDMTKMAVKVRIHESHIKKVAKGQKVKITLDAFPDKILQGEVTKVGVLPDSQNQWMNPDMKVYLTTIAIGGVYDWLKPGLSAKVEIAVKQLADVVYIPLQAVLPIEGKQYCFVQHGVDEVRREIEVGDFNDEFIEIKRGVREGEKISLRTPETQNERDQNQDPKADPNKSKSAPAADPAPAPAAKPAVTAAL